MTGAGRLQYGGGSHYETASQYKLLSPEKQARLGHLIASLFPTGSSCRTVRSGTHRPLLTPTLKYRNLVTYLQIFYYVQSPIPVAPETASLDV